MGKMATYPLVIDRCKQISITDLKNFGYLSKTGSVKFDLVWGSRSQKSKISVWLLSSRIKGFVELSYVVDGEPIKYKVKLVCKISNLGKGNIWYLVCPFSQKLCKKLYLGDKHFVNRELLEGSFYSKQLESKKYREIVTVFGKDFKIDDLYEQLHSKNFKKFYAGKPTKRFLMILKKLKQLEGENFNLKNCL